MRAPDEARELAEAVYNYRKGDKTLPKTLDDLGWQKVTENPISGAWRVRKGDIEVLLVFGGPNLDAHARWWRYLSDGTRYAF